MAELACNSPVLYNKISCSRRLRERLLAEATGVQLLELWDKQPGAFTRLIQDIEYGDQVYRKHKIIMQAYVEIFNRGSFDVAKLANIIAAKQETKHSSIAVKLANYILLEADANKAYASRLPKDFAMPDQVAMQPEKSWQKQPREDAAQGIKKFGVNKKVQEHKDVTTNTVSNRSAISPSSFSQG